MNVTLTGGSGFVGRRLVRLLLDRGHGVRVLTRHAGTNLPPGVRLAVWDAMQGPPSEEALRDADAIVNLAGEPVAQRWTTAVKQRIRESRVAGTRRLVQGIAGLERKPAALISASATGYYGSRGDEALDESAAPGKGFLAEVCVDWEREAFAAQSLGVRVAAIRTGIALGRGGGALEKMLPPFRAGLGGRLGAGGQWMPWIHMEDLAALYLFALEHAVSGPLNGAAPNPATNAEFTRELGRALRRPAVLPVPKIALRLAFGEMAGVLFDSQRVLPAGAEAAGFRFRYPELPAAMAAIVRDGRA